MRRTTFNRDLTQGSIIRNLWVLSWPILIGDSLNLIGPTIDMIWVGRLGAVSVAAVGVVGMVIMLARLGVIGINTGLRAMVARFVGAGDNEGANQVARQAFIISGAYAVVVMAAGIIFAGPILRLLGVKAAVVAEGAAYMRIAFLNILTISLYIVPEGVMQASGDTLTPMKISIFMRVIHVLLGPLLIFGWWIFPRWGVSGAAIADVISAVLGLMFALWVVFTGRSRLRITLSGFRPDFGLIWRIVRIGIPAAVMMAQQRFARILLLWFITPFGTLAVAGFSLMERIEMFIRIPGLGFGRGSAVLVGQNLGAHQPERAEKSAWLATGFVQSIVVAFSLAMLLWPASVIRIFSPDPELVETASVFLRIVVVGFFSIGFEVIVTQSLAGAGDTMPSMIITILRMWLVTIPMAYLLPRFSNLGVHGVLWGIAAGMLVSAAAFVIYFRLGRWKRKRV